MKIKIDVNRMQELFLYWNAERLGLSYQESIDRYGSSWQVYPHRGQDFRNFTQYYQLLMSVFADDSEKEYLEAYNICQYIHFLRWLSGEEYDLELDVDALPQDNVIVDYGAGIPHHSVQLALALLSAGKSVKLYLVDIKTVMSEFVAYAVNKLNIPTWFIWVDREHPYPILPKHNVCFAIDSLEHLHEPERAVANIHSSLAPGGWLIGNITDHQEEFFHVSPGLEKIRGELLRIGYTPEHNGHYYRKPDGN